MSRGLLRKLLGIFEAKTIPITSCSVLLCLAALLRMDGKGLVSFIIIILLCLRLTSCLLTDTSREEDSESEGFSAIDKEISKRLRYSSLDRITLSTGQERKGSSSHPLNLSSSCSVYSSSTDCVFNVTNNNNHKQYLILTRDTPLEGILSEFLTVKLGSKRLPYKGLYLRRMRPAEDEWTMIQPNEVISVSVDISSVYDMKAPGTYTIVYTGSLLYKHTDGLMQQSTVTYRFAPKATTAVHVQRRNGAALKTVGDIVEEYSTGRIRCIDVYRGVCKPLFDGFGSLAANVANTLQVHKTVYTYLDPAIASVDRDHSHYVRWFGARSTRNVERVRNIFKDIKTAITSGPFMYHYDGHHCLKRVLAYTWHRSRLIVLCPIQYKLPYIIHPYSQLNTLLHEMTHAVGYTIDIAYGVRKCLSLAKQSPSRAVENAANYGLYFITVLPVEYGIDSAGSYGEYRYITRGTVYVKYLNGELLCNYPKLIKHHWGSIPSKFEDGFDTILFLSDGSMYATAGDQYIHYKSMSDDSPTSGHINKLIRNLPTSFKSGFDSAALLHDKKFYFSRSSMYIRLSNGLPGTVDTGYPRQLQGQWGQLTDQFNERLDAMDSHEGRVCLFKNEKFICFDSTKYSIPNGKLRKTPQELYHHIGSISQC
ncbi:PREDICTED: uncharacterized protein LOC109583880 [Amphimedon queenslandica]|uniref:Lysine-specific metallo-endopeptidase domain-containing protein n=1 Tax=Amphimedon queenslandica TaxID=400682 RepID=A0A1X7UE43_AMPQE|nr:PREDICTED: uncharacterized protein LOC109583880 [Amphimedon queenslandica]|eukprot:XP_019854938.1 PREDICTED: uncharacterized protein LOC109583880 [Amphimedon queenslandica]